ncbi:MAG: formylglycine-generating enzyme family protein [Bacteroidetes bacterium]|nr:formylglycine-generating enzyme family protein [Bacteroidota bacterium]
MKRFLLFSSFLGSMIFFSYYSKAQKAGVPEMVKIEGGTFTMGCDEIRDPEDSAALPYHLVTLKSFSIAKTETTVAQWKAYCNATGTRMPIEPAWGWIDNHPIVNVSWDEISAYCQWLNKQTGKKYRLPTEAEWEYAARGGNKSKGFIFAGGQAPYMYSWFEENSNSTSQPVAKKRPNELGLYDMSGNAWEWCLDWWGPYSEGKKINPQGKEEGFFKVIRGGSWNYSFNDCRVGARDFFSPDGRHNDFGFRLVLEESAASTGN